MMTRQKRHNKTYLYLLAVVVCLLACTRSSHPWARLILKEPLEEPSAELRSLLTALSAGTPYENRLFINSPPQNAEDVAILFIGDGADWRGRISGLRNNCTALPKEPTIACDARFFDEYLRKALPRPSERAIVTAFGAWVLGHELGHLANGDGGGHFGNNKQKMAARNRNLEQQRREYAADCWMLNRALEMNNPDLIVKMETVAMDLINSRIRSQTPNPPDGVGLIFDYTRVDLYDFRGLGTHPDILLRATRLLHVSSFQRKDEGLRNLTASLVRKLVPDPLWSEQGPCATSQ